jgi:hypothetical protein
LPVLDTAATPTGPVAVITAATTPEVDDGA